MLAEVTARAVGQVALVEALELTALIARDDRERGRRAAARWLRRYVAEARALTVEDAALASASVLALGRPAHATALIALRAMAAQATRD